MYHNFMEKMGAAHLVSRITDDNNSIENLKRGLQQRLAMSQFEHYVFWRKALKQDKHLDIPHHHQWHQDKENDASEQSKFSRWWWWEPSRDSWIYEFCGSSAIHGLKYISKRKLSALERVFWVVAFLASLYVSWWMIAEVYDRYHKSPVIVTFNPSEVETYQLPFPAITICNKSLFSKSKILELFRALERGEHRERTLESLRLVNALCSSRRSFLRRMNLAQAENFPDRDSINLPPSQRTIDEGIVKLIFDHTQSCDHLLRLCSWDQRKRNCSELFKPIITDYGKCCVFNKIPNELIKFEIDEFDVADKRERGWSFEQVNEWDKWDYESGFIIEREGLRYPTRQKRAGNLYGLSVLVDPDMEDGFCESQDSEGLKVLLHTSADVPRISYMGTGFGLGRETFVKVYPDLTAAERNILDYNVEVRKCIYGAGKRKVGQNVIEKPYTRNNCFLTCQQGQIRQRCNCTLHYARRKRGYRICNPAVSSHDYACVRRIEDQLAGNLQRDCAHCGYACNHLKYNVEISEANLLDPKERWGNNETNGGPPPPPWAHHKISILNIFMGSDTNVPKMRQKLYARVDLFASIGGLLGLTLGFSVLTAIEVLYLLTLRICCKQFRKRQQRTSRDGFNF